MSRDLPVLIDLPVSLAREVAAYVEGDLGWQPVDGHGGLAPVLALAAGPKPGTPTIVVVADDAQPAPLPTGAVAMVTWPAQRRQLAALGAQVAAGVARASVAGAAAAPAVVRVGGAAGGAGASTVTLALAGLLAWSGLRTVAVGRDDLLALCGMPAHVGPGAAELAALPAHDAAAELVALARPVRGVPGLAVLGGGLLHGACAGWPVDVVVADVGAGTAADAATLMVSRPDHGLRRAATAGVPALVNGDGPVPLRIAHRVLDGRLVACLPASARVAQAGIRGHLPAALPGRWLAALRPVPAVLHRRAAAVAW